MLGIIVCVPSFRFDIFYICCRYNIESVSLCLCQHVCWCMRLHKLIHTYTDYAYRIKLLLFNDICKYKANKKNLLIKEIKWKEITISLKPKLI